MIERNPPPAAEYTEVTHGGYALDPGSVMLRVRAPLPVGRVMPDDFARPIPDALGRPALSHGMTMFAGPFDKSSADYFTGNHGVIQRQHGFPKGQQNPQGGPAAVVYRPTPVPWDCGTALPTGRPAATEGS